MKFGGSKSHHNFTDLKTKHVHSMIQIVSYGQYAEWVCNEYFCDYKEFREK